jgi:hypothetical protein
MLVTVFNRITPPDQAPLASVAPAGLLPDHATPSRQALGRMLVRPFGALGRAHQARLHRHVSEVRRGDDLLATISRKWRGCRARQ